MSKLLKIILMIKKRPTVLIPIETKVREFDGKMLLASYLLRSGYEVLLGNRKGVLKQLKYHKNSVYLAKSIYPQQKHIYQQMQKRNNKLCVLNVEGGILTKDEEGHFLFSYPDNLLPFLERIFLFGVKIKESFLKYRNDFNENRLVVSGDPRFQMLKPGFRQFYTQNITRLQEKYNDYILINTSFSIANPYVGEEKLFEFFNKNNDYDDKIIQGFKIKNDFYKRIIQYFIVAVKHLAYTFSDTNFIVRPHPSESLTIYQESFNDFKNVHVTNDGNVHTWILASLGVIHYDCTTGIESLLAEKPTIAYVPERDERVFAWLPAYLSKETDSLKILEEYIDNIVNGTFKQEMSDEKLKLLNSYMASNELDSASVVTDAIEQVFRKNNIDSSYEEHSFNYYRDRILTYVKQKKRELVNPKVASITQKKMGVITKNEINDKLSILNKIIGYKKKYQIIKLENNLFRIK